MKDRTIAALAAACVATLTFSACGIGESNGGSSDRPGPRNGLPESMASGLTIPFINYPPYSIVDEDGEIVGLDADLADALAEYFGVELKPASATFEQTLLGVTRGTYPWAPAASVTAERLETYDFVSYFSDRYRVLIKQDAADIGSDPTDLCGLTVGAVGGGVAIGYMEDFSEECEAEGLSPIEVKTFPDQSTVELAVKSGRIDAAAATFANATYVAEHDDDLKVSGPEYSIQTQGLTLQKGSELAEPLRDAMNALIEDGTYGEILAKYGLESAAIEESEIYDEPADADQ